MVGEGAYGQIGCSVPHSHRFGSSVHSCCSARKAAAASADSWTTMAPMPTANFHLDGAVVDGKIYAIGGGGGVNEMYDPATNSWTEEAPMPTLRWQFGTAVFKNKIYCIGGISSGGPVTGVNEVYDPRTNAWETKAPMPTPRFDLSANEVDGKIYLIGGYDSGSRTPNLTEVYDPINDSWTTKAPIPYPVVLYASAVVDNKIYVIGEDTTQIYSPPADAWSSGTPPPTIVLDATAGATTGVNAPKRIYVMGGNPSGLGAVNENLVYDPAADAWSSGASLPFARAGVAVGVVDDLLYAIGGYDGGDGSYVDYSDNQRYTPFGYGSVPPVVSVVSPQYNETYASGNVSLVFTLNKPAQQVSYSLDGQQNVTVPGNTTLTGLSNGSHSIKVYATDASGNTGASETVTFTIANTPEPFPTSWIIAAVVIVAVAAVGAGLLVYFRKHVSRSKTTLAKETLHADVNVFNRPLDK